MEGMIYPQSGVVPVRWGEDPHVLVITSKNGKYWIFPKGLIEDGMTAEESAKKEAYEEAGITGVVGKRVGDYKTPKWDGMCHVEMFLLEDVEVSEKWPEDYRLRKWVPLNESLQNVVKNDLSPIVDNILELLKLAY